MGILFICLAGLFFLIGVLLRYFKCYWLISGYNTASAEKKKNYDIESLGRFMGMCCFAMGVCFVLGASLAFAGYVDIAPISIIPLVGVVIYMLIKAQKYDGNTKNEDGSTKRSTKIIISSIVTFIVITFAIAFGSILYSMNTEHKITVNEQAIKVSGAFGTEQKLENFTEITLRNEAPVVLTKTSGLNVSDICRGSFRIKDLGNGRLYVHLNSKPYIYLLKKEGFIIINFKDSKATEKLYNELMDNWKG